jgi:hypothetical protein
MTNVEDAIRRALSPDDLRAYEALGRDPSPLQEAVAAFRSRHALMAVAAWAMGLAMLLIAAYAGWRAWGAAEVRQMLLWGALAAFALFSLGGIKLWFFMEMQTNGILRELKRLELQLASLIALSAR